jgi:hypothetical protein
MSAQWNLLRADGISLLAARIPGYAADKVPSSSVIVTFAENDVVTAAAAIHAGYMAGTAFLDFAVTEQAAGRGGLYFRQLLRALHQHGIHLASLQTSAGGLESNYAQRLKPSKFIPNRHKGIDHFDFLTGQFSEVVP